MFSLHKLFAATAGLGILALSSLMIAPAASSSGTAPVTVMNTPLPVSLQGTGQISGNVNVSGSVNVANPPSSPIPTQNVAPAPLTHMGRFASEHILLQGLAGQGFHQVSTDGTVDSNSFSIPGGSVLVITDIDWELNQGTPGTPAFVNLAFVSVNGVTSVYFSSATFDSNGQAFKNDHLIGGLVLSKIPVTSASQMILRGYLVADQ